MRRFLLKCAVQSQSYRVTRRWYSDRLIVLTYHGLTDQRRHSGIANYHGKHLFVETFARHLEHLKRHYQVITLEQAVDHYEHGTALPPHSVVLTFDDGYRSVYQLGLPLLRQYDVPAVFFLATNFVSGEDWMWPDRLEYALDHTHAQALDVDFGSGPHHFNLTTTTAKIACESRVRSLLKTIPQEGLHEAVSTIEDRLGARLASSANVPDIYRPASWAEIDEMAASGLISMGSHTASHVILGRCSDERTATELSTSRDVIQDRTGRSCRLFCYPNGKPGNFTARTGELVRQAGYRCALTTVEGMNDHTSNLFELKRLPILEHGDLDRFRLSVSGLMGHIDAINLSARRWMARRRVEATEGA